MGRRLTSLLTLAVLLAVACSHPQPAPSPRKAADQQSQPDQSPPPIDTVLAKVRELVRQQRMGAGNGDQIKSQLESARTLAGHDAALLAEVAQVALDWDPKFALEVANQAVGAEEGSIPAQLALGAALAVNARWAESREHLERAYQGTGQGLEAGYALALTMEATGDPNGARTLLTSLVNRFPGSVESRQALERVSAVVAEWPVPGTPGTNVADWDTERWWSTSELLIGVKKDQETVEAIGLDGKSRWVVACGGKANDLVLDESGSLAVLAASGHDCFVDLTSGAVLLRWSADMYYPSLEGLALRGDFMAIGEAGPQPVAVAGGPVGYFGTNWKVYRLNRNAQGKIDLQLQYEAMDGSRKAALSSDGRTLLTWMGNHGAGRPRLFKDGRLVSEYPSIPTGEEFALDPRDDRFYFLSYDGALQARSLDGTVLWEAQADKDAIPLLVWTPSRGERLIAVRYHGGAAVYSDTGDRLWTAPGMPLLPIGVNAQHYLMTRDGRDHLLYDDKGNVVGRYPADSYLARDGRAMVRVSNGRVILYRPH